MTMICDLPPSSLPLCHTLGNERKGAKNRLHCACKFYTFTHTRTPLGPPLVPSQAIGGGPKTRGRQAFSLPRDPLRPPTQLAEWVGLPDKNACFDYFARHSRITS